MRFYSGFITCLCLICSSCFKIHKAEHGNATTWSDCSRAKPTAHTGYGITLFCIVFACGSIFVRATFAQQEDFEPKHPLLMYSDTQLDESKTNNFRNNNNNNNKISPKKTSNSKIRLAAVSSADEDDRVVPAAPMPSTDMPTVSGRRVRFENDNGNNNDNNSVHKVASGDSYVGRFEQNDVANIPNTAAPSPQDKLAPTNESPRPNQQPPVDPYHPPINTASFNGVVPGHSSIKSVIDLWGKPVQETTNGGELAHLFSLHELNHIEVTYDKNKVVKSIVVRLEEPLPENAVREQFESMLLKSRPVLIPDDTGRIIGELFPEKGVVFLFSGGKNGGAFQVRQIGIEPVISEPFVLRAEATLNDQPTESYRDLVDAIRINRSDAKAYWLLAKVELLQGYTETAIVNVQKAIRFDERKPAYHLTLAQILSRMNRVEDAKLYLEATLKICERYPIDKARAFCLLGDFYRTGQEPDCENAYKLHSSAIAIAKQLADHSNPTIRQTAKDILFELYLAVAKDIAWGRWKGKEQAVKNWLSSAESIMTDPEMVAARRFSAEYPLKLAICELACQVGIRGEGDIDPYVKDAIQTGENLLSRASDPILLQKLQWDIGLAVYDAVQMYQLRGEYDFALRYGELAADYMKAGIKGRTNDSDLYLIGRLYFRLGTIHALGYKNHRAAIEWFNRAKPTFERLYSSINLEESGRYGESLVSMGVSYWQTNQREEAVRLTERGLRQIERGVRSGITNESAFAIPYSNLSNMYNELGNIERSRHYSNLSSSLKYSESRK